MRNFSDPYRTIARFKSTCDTCKDTVTKGQAIVYDKMRKRVYCWKCGQEILRGVQAERSMDMYGTDIY